MVNHGLVFGISIVCIPIRFSFGVNGKYSSFNVQWAIKSLLEYKSVSWKTQTVWQFCAVQLSAKEKASGGVDRPQGMEIVSSITRRHTIVLFLTKRIITHGYKLGYQSWIVGIGLPFGHDTLLVLFNVSGLRLFGLLYDRKDWLDNLPLCHKMVSHMVINDYLLKLELLPEQIHDEHYISQTKYGRTQVCCLVVNWASKW